jgi:thiamine pyrophosphokinase
MQAVVIAGGEPAAGDERWLAGAALVVAADGGAAWLAALDRRPDLLVGDLDSVDAWLVDRLAAAGVAVERHPVDKDASDAELALARAVELGATRVTVLGALGGQRLDHELANLLLLADPAWRALDELRIVRGDTVVRPLHGGDQLTLSAAAGTTVTLLAVGGDAAGVRTRGLRFPLDGETLSVGRSRGLSNEIVEAPASVQLERGTLLVIESPKEVR